MAVCDEAHVIAPRCAERQTQLMDQQFRIGSRLSWVVACLLAVAAPAMHLLWPGTVTWWAAMVFLVPIVLLIAWRQEEKGYEGPFGTGDGGPWGPPPA
jgi:hypothetical protein